MATPSAVPGQPPGQRNPLADALSQALGDALRQLLPQIITGVAGALVGVISGGLGGIFRRQPPAVVPPAPEPLVPAPGAPPLPQVPIAPPPALKTQSIRLVLQGMEKPQRVGGGPGVNYDDPRGMIARGEAFNFGCVGFFDATAFHQEGEWTGGSRGDLVRYDMEFRNTWRVFDAKTGALVAFLEGQGDDSKQGEGVPAPWHQSDGSAPVHFGDSKWRSSAGFGQRLTFAGEGEYVVEFEFDGVKVRTEVIRVS